MSFTSACFPEHVFPAPDPPRIVPPWKKLDKISVGNMQCMSFTSACFPENVFPASDPPRNAPPEKTWKYQCSQCAMDVVPICMLSWTCLPGPRSPTQCWERYISTCALSGFLLSYVVRTSVVFTIALGIGCGSCFVQFLFRGVVGVRKCVELDFQVENTQMRRLNLKK